MSFQLQVNIYSEPVNFLEELGSLLYCIVDGIEQHHCGKLTKVILKKNLYEH